MSLSGGKRQRIGIAGRYINKQKSPSLMRLRERLTLKLSRGFMSAIDSLGNDRAILIIMHGLSTPRGCDQVVELIDSIFIWTKSYEEIVCS